MLCAMLYYAHAISFYFVFLGRIWLESGLTSLRRGWTITIRLTIANYIPTRRHYQYEW